MTARLTLEYDGTAFSGWARQPDRRTVQGEVERALGVLLRRPVTVAVAGRTDAGVHAWGQVASYAGEPVCVRSLNAVLASDVAALRCEAALEGFHARLHARSRTYCYRVLHRPARSVHSAGRALWWPRPLDRGALRACAAALVGTHDFTAFTPTQTQHVRFRRDVLRAGWSASPCDPDVLELWVEADAFLRHMIRVLVGTMLEVAGGRGTVEEFAALLCGAPRSAAGRTAPAHGLALASVRYPEMR
jgi:tRNA pseudouridine38-40 synthase